MDYLIHTANILYIFSYMVRDILWLRILIIIAICFVIPFYYFQPVPLMAPVYWNILFATINIVQVIVLLIERRPVKLSENEERLYKMVFRTLTPREARKMFKMARWGTAEKGDLLVKKDSMLEGLMLINKGKASVQLEDDQHAELGEGHFVGEMSYITGNKTSASVVADSQLEYVTWPLESLKPFLDKNTELRAALTAIIGIDLARKITR